jgi:hypothetical protein
MNSLVEAPRHTEVFGEFDVWCSAAARPAWLRR